VSWEEEMTKYSDLISDPYFLTLTLLQPVILTVTNVFQIPALPAPSTFVLLKIHVFFGKQPVPPLAPCC
jgi:hypothetical protein